jgi:hypothetical protein
VGGYITDIGQLQARTPEEFAAMHITVHTGHEVMTLDPKAGKLTSLPRLDGTICGPKN